MYNFLYDYFNSIANEKQSEILAYVVLAIIISALCFVSYYVIRFIVLNAITRLVKRTGNNWDDILLDSKLFHRLSYLVIPIVLNFFAGSFPNESVWHRISDVITILVTISVLDSVINSIDQIYRKFEISKTRPIKGLLQIAKVAMLIIGGILLIAALIGESPMVLLGGIGALTAVTSLIFKDAIVGFVAGIQLSANDMIRIGDWIEASKYSASGTVIDLTLTTVKVRNFDNTITTIPAYTLVSDAFINWRGMQSSGGRRIKRAIYIDAGDVRLCDEEMLAKFKKIYLLKDYINSKLTEIEKYNKEHHFDMSVRVNGRRLTNIGTFRAYINEYLKQHPGIRKDMTMMVRQLDPTSKGIPLEVYAFTNTVKWVEYEGIQSDIFDHLYSVAQEFGLSVYQEPSGKDIRNCVDFLSKGTDELTPEINHNAEDSYE